MILKTQQKRACCVPFLCSSARPPTNTAIRFFFFFFWESFRATPYHFCRLPSWGQFSFKNPSFIMLRNGLSFGSKTGPFSDFVGLGSNFPIRDIYHCCFFFLTCFVDSKKKKKRKKKNPLFNIHGACLVNRPLMIYC